MYDLEKLEIRKEVVKKGSDLNVSQLSNGSKVIFHFKTYTCNGQKEENLVDDSKKLGKPFELLIGKNFKLQCWESCVKTMQLNEVARFFCPKSQVFDYPLVSQNLRDIHSGKDQHKSHTCGFNALKLKSCGYPDLDKMKENQPDLCFEFEVIKVHKNNEYEKELWQMDTAEMIENIPNFHLQGNTNFKQGNIKEAEKFYKKAISCLKHLQMKERPGTEKWVSMDRQQIPLMLNYAQCKLNGGDCTTCIHICTEVLDKVEGADNVKAYFKRGKAHSILLNERECCEDFTKAIKLDPKVRHAVEKQLRVMQQQLKSRDKDLHQSLRGMFD